MFEILKKIRDVIFLENLEDCLDVCVIRVCYKW